MKNCMFLLMIYSLLLSFSSYAMEEERQKKSKAQVYEELKQVCGDDLWKQVEAEPDLRRSILNEIAISEEADKNMILCGVTEKLYSQATIATIAAERLRRSGGYDRKKIVKLQQHWCNNLIFIGLINCLSVATTITMWSFWLNCAVND